MSEMVDRVAGVLAAWDPTYPNHKAPSAFHVSWAEAVIEAMREPTRVMAEDNAVRNAFRRLEPADVWIAMITAALRED